MPRLAGRTVGRHLQPWAWLLGALRPLQDHPTPSYRNSVWVKVMSTLDMRSQENVTSARRAWDQPKGQLLLKQWGRMGFGCVLGAFVSVGLHLLQRDVAFASYLQESWARLIKEHFDGLQSYKPELIALCIGLAMVAVIPIPRWLWRFVRSWWIGIVSVTSLVAACTTIAVLEYGRDYPKMAAVGGLASLVAVVLIEIWQQRPKEVRSSESPLHLKIPIPKRNLSTGREWKASSSDDPISDWQDDTIGRTAVVEVLAEHAIRLHTPVVALNGEFGDGKSSALNLLKKAVEGQAIVILFNAWLPGSEATLATDLFTDIATECKKHAYVPQLRKQALAYARTLSRSVSFLSGLKELLPTQSQQEEVQELRESFSHIPQPILVLLDEIDRMQKDELLVLLKILRGASSIPNVTFVCAFSEKQIRGEISKDGSLAPDYLEKFFPVSVNLPAPDPNMIGRCFQDQLKKTLAGIIREK